MIFTIYYRIISWKSNDQLSVAALTCIIYYIHYHFSPNSKDQEQTKTQRSSSFLLQVNHFFYNNKHIHYYEYILYTRENSLMMLIVIVTRIQKNKTNVLFDYCMSEQKNIVPLLYTIYILWFRNTIKYLTKRFNNK